MHFDHPPPLSDHFSPANKVAAGVVRKMLFGILVINYLMSLILTLVLKYCLQVIQGAGPDILLGDDCNREANFSAFMREYLFKIETNSNRIKNL